MVTLVLNIHLVVDTVIIGAFLCVCVCACVWFFFKEQEKAEKASKLEYTLKEVESSTKELRDLLERQAISGTMLELSDYVMVCVVSCKNDNNYPIVLAELWSNIRVAFENTATVYMKKKFPPTEGFFLWARDGEEIQGQSWQDINING